MCNQPNNLDFVITNGPCAISWFVQANSRACVVVSNKMGFCISPITACEPFSIYQNPSCTCSLYFGEYVKKIFSFKVVIQSISNGLVAGLKELERDLVIQIVFGDGLVVVLNLIIHMNEFK